MVMGTGDKKNANTSYSVISFGCRCVVRLLRPATVGEEKH